MQSNHVGFKDHDSLHNPPIGQGYMHEAKAFAATLRDGAATFPGADEGSLVVALCGPWGSGKTYFMRRVFDILRYNVYAQRIPTIVEFDPWSFQDSTQLVQQFFVQIDEALREDLQEADTIEDTTIDKREKLLKALSFSLTMGAAIASAALPFVGLMGLPTQMAEQIGKGISDVGSTLEDIPLDKPEEWKPRSFVEYKEVIDSCLSELDSRLVVVIDNIDRLDKDRTRLLFQLVAAMSSFERVCYVLVFDREVVAYVLSEVQGYGSDEKSPRFRATSGEAYLEKLIQVWYELPELDVLQLISLLLERDEYRGLRTWLGESNRKLLSRLLSTPRQTHRLFEAYHSALQFNRQPFLFRECDECEVLFIESLLRLRYPLLYRRMRLDDTSGDHLLRIGRLRVGETAASASSKMFDTTYNVSNESENESNQEKQRQTSDPTQDAWHVELSWLASKLGDERADLRSMCMAFSSAHSNEELMARIMMFREEGWCAYCEVILMGRLLCTIPALSLSSTDSSNSTEERNSDGAAADEVLTNRGNVMSIIDSWLGDDVEVSTEGSYRGNGDNYVTKLIDNWEENSHV